MPKELSNKLNIWDEAKTNYSQSSVLEEDSQRVNGFQTNDYLKSATFNGILLEMSLVTKSLIGALQTVTTGSARTGSLTINNTTSSSDLITAIKDILEDVLVSKATNIAGGSAGSLIYQRAAGQTDFIPAGENGQVLIYNTSVGKGVWTNQNTIIAGSATNLRGGTTGQIPVQSSANNTVMTNPANITVGNAEKLNNKTLTMSYNSVTGVLSISYV